MQINDGTSTTNVDGKLSGVVSGAGGGLVKAGAGTLQLTQANTYTGRTTVSGGVLRVDGSLANGSAVTVGGASASGSPTLTGAGLVNGSVSVASAGGGAGGTVNPGSVGGVGTLGTGALTFNTGSTYAADLANDTKDLLAVTGNASLGGTLAITPTGIQTLGKYALLTTTGGAVSGTFAATTGAPTNYKVTYAANEVDLQHVADQSFTRTTASPVSIIAGSTLAVGGNLVNTAPTGSIALTTAPADNGGSLTVTGLPAAGALPAGSTLAVGGSIAVGTAGLGKTWGIKNVDANALPADATASITGTVNVFNHASGVLTLTTASSTNAFIGATVTSGLSFANSGANNDNLSVTGAGGGLGSFSGTFAANQSVTGLTGTATASATPGAVTTNTFSASWLEDQTVVGATSGTQTSNAPVTITAFDHASVANQSVAIRLTQGSSATAAYSLANASGAFRDQAQVTAVSSDGGGFASGAGAVNATPINITAGSSSSPAYTASFTASQANVAAGTSKTFGFTYGDKNSYAGFNNNNQVANVTFNATVDALAEHVQTVTNGRTALGGSNFTAANGITVTKSGAGSYTPGYADGLNASSGAVKVTVSGGDSTFESPSILLVDFGTFANLNLINLENDLSSFGYTWYDRAGAHGAGGSTLTGTNTGELLNFNHQQYDLELAFNPAATGATTYFDFNFANAAYNGGTGLTVQNLAVVPEPASLGALAMGAVGLVGRRRRRQA